MELKLRNRLSRFFEDYGMVFVLLLLCAFFSVMTYTEQHPTGAAAGEQLAGEIAARRGNGARVVILAGQTSVDEEFVRALASNLEAGGATVVRTVTGGPPEMRRALEEVAASGQGVDVIACDESTSRYSFLRERDSKLPGLAGVELAIPATYAWPDFLKAANLRAVANRIAVIAIIAIGMTFVIITGGIDLSVGSLIALSAVVATLLIREVGGAVDASTIAMIICSLAAILGCALMGAFSGLMVTAFRVPAFIATLAMMLIASGLAYRLSNSQSIYQIPESYRWLGTEFVFGVPNPVILMLILYGVAHFLMTRTTFGRYVYAVGGNREAARLSGVPVKPILLSCYTVCGGLAGVGGIIRASELKSGEPTYGLMTELEVIAAVVVGGTSLSGGEGKIFGTLIGALVIGVMRNGLNLTNVESNTQKVVLGLVIVAAVLLDNLKRRK